MSMPDGICDYGRFDELAEEFAGRYRRGERPSLQEYIDRLPELADEIRELFPALIEVKRVEGDGRDDATTHSDAPRHTKIGDYQVVREIGRGGMGVVYEAEQVSLGRRVALKVLPQQIAHDPKALERFRREAKAAARLHHTNIVPVFEVGQDGEVGLLRDAVHPGPGSRPGHRRAGAAQRRPPERRGGEPRGDGRHDGSQPGRAHDRPGHESLLSGRLATEGIVPLPGDTPAAGSA